MTDTAAGPRSGGEPEHELLKVEGELSIGRAGELLHRFREAIDRGREIAVDCGGVQACDAAGLQLIFSLHKTAAARGLGFRIVAQSRTVEENAAKLGLTLGGAGSSIRGGIGSGL